MSLTPYYADDAVTIYHGDCRDVLPLLDADIAVTDPPYNASKSYGAHDDAMSRTEYVAWCHEWFGLLPERRILFPGVGNQWVWAEKEPKAVACWYKPGNPGGGGPFQFCEWEPILLWGVNFRLSDVFHFSISTQADIGSHPCPKPLRLMRAVLDRLRTPGSIIDPFAGSGTTLRAAKDVGRKAIGIEIEERYCEIAARRCAQEVLDLRAPRESVLNGRHDPPHVLARFPRRCRCRGGGGVGGRLAPVGDRREGAGQGASTESGVLP